MTNILKVFLISKNRCRVWLQAAAWSAMTELMELLWQQTRSEEASGPLLFLLLDAEMNTVNCHHEKLTSLI